MARAKILDVPELSGIAGIQWMQAEQTGSEETTSTVLHGKATGGALFNNDILESLPNSRIGTYGWYSGHIVRYGYGRQFDEIDLTAVELTVEYNKNGYYSKFEATARTENRPLEEKREQLGSNDETYLLWWNHEVRALSTAAALTAGQITTLKTYSDLSSGTGIDGYYWVKNNQARKSTEEVFLDARFPGVQSYGVPFEQVKEIVFARSDSVIRDIMRAVGQLRNPSDSAGKNYDDTRIDPLTWLITSGNFRRRLGWYEAELTYAYAKGGWLNYDVVSPVTGVYPKYENN